MWAPSRSRTSAAAAGAEAPQHVARHGAAVAPMPPPRQAASAPSRHKYEAPASGREPAMLLLSDRDDPPGAHPTQRPRVARAPSAGLMMTASSSKDLRENNDARAQRPRSDEGLRSLAAALRLPPREALYDLLGGIAATGVWGEASDAQSTEEAGGVSRVLPAARGEGHGRGAAMVWPPAGAARGGAPASGAEKRNTPAAWYARLRSMHRVDDDKQPPRVPSSTDMSPHAAHVLSRRTGRFVHALVPLVLPEASSDAEPERLADRDTPSMHSPVPRTPHGPADAVATERAAPARGHAQAGDEHAGAQASHPAGHPTGGRDAPVPWHGGTGAQSSVQALPAAGTAADSKRATAAVATLHSAPTLPPVPRRGSSPQGPPTSASRGALAVSGLRVLVVEDEAVNRRMLCRMLQRIGVAHVDEADDGTSVRAARGLDRARRASVRGGVRAVGRPPSVPFTARSPPRARRAWRCGGARAAAARRTTRCCRTS